MEKNGQLKIGIIGERRKIIFFKGLGFEIFPVEEKKEEDDKILDLIEKKGDFGIIFIDQNLISKIKKEKLEEWQKKLFPVIVFLSFSEEIANLRELGEIMKRAIGKEEIII